MPRPSHFGTFTKTNNYQLSIKYSSYSLKKFIISESPINLQEMTDHNMIRSLSQLEWHSMKKGNSW